MASESEDKGNEGRDDDRIKKFGFTLKSPLGYNKQIKTAKALIIQQCTQQKGGGECSKAEKLGERTKATFFFFCFEA